MYYYKYELNLQRKLKSIPASMGSLIHKCLEIYYREGYKHIPKAFDEFNKSLSKLFDEERALYKDLPQEVARIMRGYHLYWQDYKNLRVVRDEQGPLVEREIVVPITQDISVKVVIDLMAEDPLGLWIVDHKSCKDLPQDDFRTTDVQSTLYYWVARQLGYRPNGIMWNYIRTKAPTEPKVLKSGGLSRAKIDTDKATYLEAIKKYGLDPADYQDILSSLSYKSFFTRIKLPKPAPVVKSVLRDLVTVGKRMMRLQGKPEAYFVRSLQRSCDWDCEFRPLCIADLLGHDTQFMIATHYERREDSGEEVEEG
jgi:hypothetical protein